MFTALVQVSGNAALAAAIASGAPDGIIALEPGRYANVQFIKVQPTRRLIVISADPRNPATIDLLKVRDSRNIEFRNIRFQHDIASPAEQSRAQIEVFQSGDIAFNTVAVMGRDDDDPANDGGGLRAQASQRIAVINSRFRALRYAVYGQGVRGMIVGANQVSNVREGFNFTDMENASIDRNLFRAFRPILDGPNPDHPDAIQIWTRGGHGSRDVEITNNAFLLGNGIPIQGLFMRSEVGDSERHRDIRIQNNAYFGQSTHGISVADADFVTIRNNSVLAAPVGNSPKSGVRAHYDPAILTNNVKFGKLTDNIATHVLSRATDLDIVNRRNIILRGTRTNRGESARSVFNRTITANDGPAAFVRGKKGAGFRGADHIGGIAGGAPAAAAFYLPAMDRAGVIVTKKESFQ